MVLDFEDMPLQSIKRQDTSIIANANDLIANDVGTKIRDGVMQREGSGLNMRGK